MVLLKPENYTWLFQILSAIFNNIHWFSEVSEFTKNSKDIIEPIFLLSFTHVPGIHGDTVLRSWTVSHNPNHGESW